MKIMNPSDYNLKYFLSLPRLLNLPKSKLKLIKNILQSDEFFKNEEFLNIKQTFIEPSAT